MNHAYRALLSKEKEEQNLSWFELPILVALYPLSPALDSHWSPSYSSSLVLCKCMSSNVMQTIKWGISPSSFNLTWSASFCLARSLSASPKSYVGGNPNQRTIEVSMLTFFIPDVLWCVVGPSLLGLQVNCDCLLIWGERMTSSQLLDSQDTKFPETEISPFCP